MIHAVDYLFLFVLFVVQPINSAYQYRRIVAQAEAGQPPDRLHLYRHTQLALTSALLVLAGTWWFLGRAIGDLGLVVSGGAGFWLGAVAVAAGTAWLVASLRKCRGLDAKGREKARASLGKLVYMLPQSDRELRRFFGVSITAGVVEEIIYRGYAIWALSLLMPTWGAIIVSSVAFGLGHSYQGKTGTVQTAVVGLLLAVLYVVSGSIWLPILAHALLDILQGETIREILKEPDGADPAADMPAV